MGHSFKESSLLIFLTCDYLACSRIMSEFQNKGRGLKVLGIIITVIFLGLAYQWGSSIHDTMEGIRAIKVVRGQIATNLIESDPQTDGRSYDWIARKVSTDTYYVKHNLVLDRIWRFDRWENYCWIVKPSTSKMKMVNCNAIGWDRAPRIQSR